jgi:hypothetical protein
MGLHLSPRVVEIVGPTKAVLLDRYGGHCGANFVAEAPRVCRNSRTAVLRLYPLLLGDFLQQPKIRFNSEIDTLYFSYKTIRWLLPLRACLADPTLGKTRLRHLAIDDELPYSEVFWPENGFWRSLELPCQDFGHLKTIIIAESIWAMVGNKFWSKHANNNFAVERNKGLEFFDEIPEELFTNTKLGLSRAMAGLKKYERTKNWSCCAGRTLELEVDGISKILLSRKEVLI